MTSVSTTAALAVLSSPALLVPHEQPILTDVQNDYCLICNKRYASEALCRAHTMRLHKTPTTHPFACQHDGCDARYVNASNLVRHVSSKHFATVREVDSTLDQHLNFAAQVKLERDNAVHLPQPDIELQAFNNIELCPPNKQERLTIQEHLSLIHI